MFAQVFVGIGRAHFKTRSKNRARGPQLCAPCALPTHKRWTPDNALLPLNIGLELARDLNLRVTAQEGIFAGDLLKQESQKRCFRSLKLITKPRP